ncbi:MAG: TrkH family potassium uptake protein [Deltaproteobacteria bacterium]|nr:TrkH family potassium uptake protein [Deltaproteobacteria bacterium]
MYLQTIGNIAGWLSIVLGVAQLAPVLVSLYLGEQDWRMLLASGAVALVLGGITVVLCRGGREIRERDGFFVVTVGWIVASLIGALPYILTGTIVSFTDAVFESMAGFTTTGASVITDYSKVSSGMFLWRSLTQWFGGMGIIVLALVILPALGIGGMQLYKREVPGPYSEKLTPRLRDTARALWSVYVLITVLEVLALYMLGMSFFDAVNHALTTVSTGGFSTRPESVAAFSNPMIHWTIIIFMFIAGMNFSLHYRLLTRQGRRHQYLRDTEWRWYVYAVVIASVMVSISTMITKGYDAGTAFTNGTFQVVSIMTTTGFVTDDYMLWGGFAQLLLLFMMIAGGCAGSTSGGVKWVRLLLVFKYIHMELLRLVHPKIVMHAKINNQRVSPDILSKIFALFFLFMTTLAFSTLLIALDGHTLMTSLGAAASALGNVGPGLGAVGPVETYAPLSDYVKWVLIITMMMGRLELMTVFVLFMPHVWRY